MAEGTYHSDIISVKKETKILTRRDIRILPQITATNIYMSKNTTENRGPKNTRLEAEPKTNNHFWLK